MGSKEETSIENTNNNRSKEYLEKVGLRTLAISEACFSIARRKNLPSKMCFKAYSMGYLVNIGVLLSQTESEARLMCNYALKELGVDEDITYALVNRLDKSAESTPLLDILNEALLSINSKGEQCSVEEVIDEIITNYGTNSKEYSNAVVIASKLNLADHKG